ncbi:cation:proton antiporter [Neptunomonas antarctica]|uniref:Sodium/proton antiporter, CPA1 family n=1 Tax=Neptunomonas antarctica TaxID=619304 RepID=A0A1N7KGL3_9GAMM|nr:cation:proton antiporter [Neptunomonas antarctica]SIS60732.1 sodium/proton antiporter, CPA1 family [Neptunomonas antarctica]
MTSAQWFLLIGGLLLTMGLTPSLIKRLPITSAILYLAVGFIIGPSLLNAFHFNPLKEAPLLEVLTEVAVLISLFAAGVKMPVPFSLPRWRSPILLAFGAMTISVALMTLFGHFTLGLPLGAALLLGAILAPTDPVLATDVQIRHPGDHDRLRFTLTCEAGMNDGSAFPFVMLGLGLLGLHDLGTYGARWILVDVLWATSAGILIGVVLGTALGRLSMMLRRRTHTHDLLDDFLGLGLIATVYGVSEMVEAWGFLAVFFAAVALRHSEHRSMAREAIFDKTDTETQSMDVNSPTASVSEGSLIFKEHLERLSELVLILLVGGSLFLDSWSWRAIATAGFLFIVARPLSVLIGLWASRTPMDIRAMTSWFGVRGIGSLYYLMFAIQHGLPESLALELIHITLIVITLSILVHGISVKPLLKRFESLRRRSPQATRTEKK